MLYLYLSQVFEVTGCHCLVPVSQGGQWHRGPPAPTEAGSSMDHGPPPARVGGLASTSSGLEFEPCRKSEVNTFYMSRKVLPVLSQYHILATCHTRGVACIVTISHTRYMLTHEVLPVLSQYHILATCHTRGVACVATIRHTCYMSHMRCCHNITYSLHVTHEVLPVLPQYHILATCNTRGVACVVTISHTCYMSHTRCCLCCHNTTYSLHVPHEVLPVLSQYHILATCPTRGVACVVTISHTRYMSHTRPERSPEVTPGPQTRRQQASSQISLRTPPIHPVGRFARGAQEPRTPQGPRPAQKPLSDNRSPGLSRQGPTDIRPGVQQSRPDTEKIVDRPKPPHF
uniref:Uncharacterized protein n=1 Tax=Timema douglasi TaxID=61478 RepID=A0A7R8W0D7_TIMDO|nr:unnamed protein product [Timema douglasi]